MKLILWLVVLSLFCAVHGANILFIAPSIAFSMILHSGKLADLLVQDGHNVTFLILEFSDTHGRNGTRLAHVVRMKDLPLTVSDQISHAGDAFGPSVNSFAQRRAIFDAVHGVFERVLARAEELAPLRAMQFDAVFTNDLTLSTTALAHWLGAKRHLWIASTVLHEFHNLALGVPSPPSFLPVVVDQPSSPAMPFWERVQNVRRYLETLFLYHDICRKVDAMFQSFAGPHFPSVQELARRTALVFVNDNEFLDWARPVLHKTVYVGGVGMAVPRPLEPQFEAIMGKGRVGVVVVAFGTAMDTREMDAGKKSAMVRAFAAFPDFHFLWVVTRGDEGTPALGQGVPNVEFVNWIPQTDLFAHPRARALVSHGGLNTVLEAAVHGLPMISIPLAHDHFRNAKMPEFRGSGTVLLKENLNQENLEHHLRRVLLDPSFAKAAGELKNMIATQPNQPDETFVKWTNFVLENGNLPHLIPYGTELSFFVYFGLDVLAAVAGTVLTIVALFWLILTRACRRTPSISPPNSNSKSLKKKKS